MQGNLVSEVDTTSGVVTPPEPTLWEPDDSWEHIDVFEAVKKALTALPYSFATDLVITGVAATDLFSFNTSLGASIENQVVKALNEIRPLWDPNQRYLLYRFVRQSQRFPDVILRASDPTLEPNIIMGIELKGWYALATESEPSFRYTVTPPVCAPADLLVVFPWALSSVVSGSPQLFEPYVVGARYAAEYRNWHWQYKRNTSADTEIRLSTSTNHYPVKSDQIADVPASDSGKNFGRFARTNLMKPYIDELYRQELSGIPLAAWQKFLSLFSEDQTEDRINSALDRMSKEYAQGKPRLSIEAIEGIKTRLTEITALLQSG